LLFVVMLYLNSSLQPLFIFPLLGSPLWNVAFDSVGLAQRWYLKKN